MKYSVEIAQYFIQKQYVRFISIGFKHMGKRKFREWYEPTHEKHCANLVGAVIFCCQQ